MEPKGPTPSTPRGPPPLAVDAQDASVLQTEGALSPASKTQLMSPSATPSDGIDHSPRMALSRSDSTPRLNDALKSPTGRSDGPLSLRSPTEADQLLHLEEKRAPAPSTPTTAQPVPTPQAPER